MLDEKVRKIKTKILQEEARLLRLKKQGYKVDEVLENIKSIKHELQYIEAHLVRVSRQAV